ncbi:hypothetical protein DNTS_014422, partial [Danionella cerebrum]
METVQLSCSHSIKDYFMILWYQQLEEELNLIAYVYYNSPTVESQFKNGFSVQGNGAKYSALNITTKDFGSTMTFYCAASKAHLLWFLISGQSLSDKVHQTPSEILVQTRGPEKLICVHTIPDFDMISWYVQLKSDTALSLIGYVRYTYSSTVDEYKDRFNVMGNGAKNSTLDFKPNVTGSSVTYYCAASEA